MVVLPQFNPPWRGFPVEPGRRDKVIYLKSVVDIIAFEVQRIMSSMDEVDRRVYSAGYDCLDTALMGLKGVSDELDDAEFQFTRPGARSLSEAIGEVLEEEEKGD